MSSETIVTTIMKHHLNCLIFHLLDYLEINCNITLDHSTTTTTHLSLVFHTFVFVCQVPLRKTFIIHISFSVFFFFFFNHVWTNLFFHTPTHRHLVESTSYYSIKCNKFEQSFTIQIELCIYYYCRIGLSFKFFVFSIIFSWVKERESNWSSWAG